MTVVGILEPVTLASAIDRSVLAYYRGLLEGLEATPPGRVEPGARPAAFSPVDGSLE